MPHRAVDHARLVLSLAFTDPVDGLAALTDVDWAEIDRLAAQHRLQPWLAERWADRDSPIPAVVIERWQRVRRHAAMTALSQRADLIAIARRLDEAGIASVALKGPWFAWYAYPAPALGNCILELAAAES